MTPTSSQQQQGGQSGPPTNEQLTQFLMIVQGMNRETAAQQMAADPDAVKQKFQKVKQLIESGGQGGQGGQSGQGSQAGSQPSSSGMGGQRDKDKDK